MAACDPDCALLMKRSLPRRSGFHGRDQEACALAVMACSDGSGWRIANMKETVHLPGGRAESRGEF